LYLASRSVGDSDPVLICPELVATAEIGNRGVLGFARAMRKNRAPSGPLSDLDGFQRLGQGTDLVDCDEQGVGDAL
jgi:hypothetical protein